MAFCVPFNNHINKNFKCHGLNKFLSSKTYIVCLEYHVIARGNPTYFLKYYYLKILIEIFYLKYQNEQMDGVPFVYNPQYTVPYGSLPQL
jgi:hypothetical protein